jgi:hypothetical protein
MAQSFCNQCGVPLDSSGNCVNVDCVAYSPQSAPAATAVSTPPAAPDLFADAPFGGVPAFSDPEVLAPATAFDRDWIAAGDAGQNEFYLGNRLAFQPPEGILSGSPELRIIQTAAVRLAFLGSFVFVISLVVSIVFGFIFGPKMAIAFFVLVNLGFFIVQLLLPIRIPVSEWMLLLDNKGAGAESAFAQITDAFRRRESPVEPRARRVSFRGPGGVGKFASNAPPVRNYLAVRYGAVAGYISVFAFGNDLYVGWTLWWQQRPIRSHWNHFRQMLATMLGRDVQFQLAMRADDAKALRELMHSAAREGVDVATRGLTITLAGTVGADVPVEAFQPAFEE